MKTNITPVDFDIHDNDSLCIAPAFEFWWRLLSRGIVLFPPRSLSFQCAIMQCARDISEVTKGFGRGGGGYFRKIGISERCVFPLISVGI